MHIFHRELDLFAGFKASAVSPCKRVLDGERFSACSGFDLFLSLRGRAIACWSCGCVADRWINMSHPSSQNAPPVLNLYAMKVHNRALGILVPVMMTRDHIIPKALGGVDRVANLRPGCTTCNAKRGTKMAALDVVFMKAHPHLISAERIRANALRREAGLKMQHPVKSAKQGLDGAAT